MVRLINAENAIISDDMAIVTITNEETGSGLSIEDVTMDESAGEVDVVVTLDPAVNNGVEVTLFTRPGTAQPARNFFGTTTRVAFEAGETSKTVKVLIHPWTACLFSCN